MKTTQEENNGAKDVFSGGLCIHEGWLGLKPTDYRVAVIRLATLAHTQSNLLIFGWMELLPNEITSPPEATRQADFGSDRYYFSRSVLPLVEGLAWYNAACAGIFTVPKATCTFVPGQIAPEPSTKRFVVRNDVPFSPDWHVTPRVHRLVPMGDPQGPLADLVSKMVEVNRFKEARQWLERQLHFDVCAYDDWFGSLALVAPNPLLRSSRAHIRRSAFGETVQVSAQLRSGVDHSTLSVRFQEHRAGADGWTYTCGFDSLGSAGMRVLGTADAIEYQIVCSERGLLDFQPTTNWISVIASDVNVQEGNRTVLVPPRRKGDPQQSYDTPILSKATSITVGKASKDGLSQLKTLQTRREAKTGEYRPLGTVRTMEEVMIFENDRAAAVDFIREQIRRARSKVVFVDPYFNPIDLTEFGYAVSWPNVSVKILIGPGNLRGLSVSAPQGVKSDGDWLAQAIKSVPNKAKELRIEFVPIS